MGTRTRNLPAKRDNQSTALATKDDVREMLGALGPQIEALLPQTIDMRTMVAVCLNAIDRDSKLLKCSRRSFIGAILECGRMGLYPDGVLGHAYLIPFGGQVQLVTGFKGKIALAIKSGQVADINGYTVHEGDLFDYAEGTQPFVKHKTTVPKHADTLTHAYATAILKAIPTMPKFAVIDKAEIDRTRQRSPGGGGGTWETDYVAMARKTAIHRLCTTLQLSPEHSRATALDTMAEAGISQRLDSSPMFADLSDADEVLGKPDDLPPQDVQPDDDLQMPEDRGNEPETPPRSTSKPSQSRSQDPGKPKGSSRGSDGKRSPHGPTERQIKRLFGIGYGNNWDGNQIKDYVAEVFDGKHLDDLTPEEYDGACAYIENNDP